MTLDIAKLKAAAEKATALNLDTADIKREQDECVECPICSGEGYVDVDADYCNIDGVALGVLFYGIGEHHGLAEEYFRAATPAAVLELIAALEAKDALIAEQDKRLVDYAAIATKSASRVAELEKKAAFLNEKLSQLANFNPDWDMLEAAADSLREHMTELTAANKRIAELEAQASAHDRLCDSNYLAGMTVGWNFGIVEDSDGFDKCHAARARRWPDDSVSLKIEGE